MRLSLKKKLNPKQTQAIFIPLFAGQTPAAKLAPLAEKPIGSEGCKLPENGNPWWTSMLPSSATRVFLVKAGKRGERDTLPLLARRLVSLARDFGVSHGSLLLSEPTPLTPDELTSLLDFFHLGSYRFDRYRTKKKGDMPPIELILAGHPEWATSLLKQRQTLLDRVHEVRDLVNEPPSRLTPDHFVAMTSSSPVKSVTCRVYRRVELEREKMAGILAVAAGSPIEPALIRLEYVPKNPGRTVALIGKGITFDSGGLSLKPGSAMEDMKSDMAGAAAVYGAVLAAAKLALPIQVVGWLPLAENLPGTNATKPGDIVTFSNGKTVEIVNTDAEGRLLLADALLAARREKPSLMVSLSTLTGAMAAALGDQFAGLMCRSRPLARGLLEAGERTREQLWEMPMHEGYRDSIHSTVADLKNANYQGASALKTGLFLDEFAGKVPYAHIDMAGTAFLNKSNRLFAEGATGYGVRLLVDFLAHLD